MKIKCPNCLKTFDWNEMSRDLTVDDAIDTGSNIAAPSSEQIECPNCQFQISI